MQTTNTVEHRPSITFLNMTGDITISWDETNRDAILALVQEKMKSGHRFFIIKPRLLGLLGSSKVAVTDVSQAAKAGAVVVEDAVARDILNESCATRPRPTLDDPALEAAVQNGHAKLAAVQGGRERHFDTQGIATKPEQVLTQQTVVVRPIAGG